MNLPEFTAWAVIYQAEAADLANLPLARTLAASVVDPELQARAAALTLLSVTIGLYGPAKLAA